MTTLPEKTERKLGLVIDLDTCCLLYTSDAADDP